MWPSSDPVALFGACCVSCARRKSTRADGFGAIGDNVPFPPPFIAADPNTIKRMQTDDDVFQSLGKDAAANPQRGTSWAVWVSDYATFMARWTTWANAPETSGWARASWDTLMQFEADFAQLRTRFVTLGGTPSRASIVPPFKPSLDISSGAGFGVVLGIAAVVGLGFVASRR